jgi:hypothetical protein
MKVPIANGLLLNLGAPTVPAYAAFIDGSTYWLVWCEHCGTWHRHGPAEGHWEAHCDDPASPYWRTGYNLAYAGKWAEL